MMSKFWIQVALILFLISSASAVSIGAVPSSLDLGKVEPGQTIEQNIYITVRGTDSNQNFTIDPVANEIGNKRLFSGRFDNPEEISEQSATEWWDLQEATVSPNNKVEADLDQSNLPTLNGFTEATLRIPEDAEPGFRYGKINLNPLISEEGSGGRVSLVSPTSVSYSFYVSDGDPRRDIVAQDVRAFRLGEDRASVEVLLSNQGTVTASTQEFEIDVLDSGRSNEVTLEIDDTPTLDPGESQWVDASWQNEQGIEQGTYQIDGEVNYFTGSAYASGSFALPGFDVVEVRPEDSPAVDSQDNRGGVPLWLVLMVIVLLGVLMWSFDIEPFWILAITGGLGIAAFILLSSVSNYLLILLIMVTAILAYGAM